MQKDELDQVADDLKYIHPPEVKDVSRGTTCFLDRRRMCEPDCTAFCAESGLDEKGQVLDTPNKCLVLLYLGQLGSGALAQLRRPVTRSTVIDPITGQRREA